MIDRLPDGTVERRIAEALWAHIIDSGKIHQAPDHWSYGELACAALAALPPGTVIVVGERGQVTCIPTHKAVAALAKIAALDASEPGNGYVARNIAREVIPDPDHPRYSEMTRPSRRTVRADESPFRVPEGGYGDVH